ncbi:MAG: UDP-N-acetylmuramoyl-tripeptide--D-alanyl-D-alanine ligase [Niabella sp.]
MNIEKLYEIYTQYPQVQTDTRKLQTGDIFFALKGPNFNGNKFARQAIEAGAAYSVIDEKEFEIPGKTILVDDVMSTLQELAHYHRRQFQIPFIAVTGSNGKTTTKELIHAVLNQTFKTSTTEGNLNNHIGVPLTLLKIRPGTEMAVVEMGANHLGEIAGYCNVADPTHGIITNCGKAHLEGFGSLEGVKKAKGELYDHLRQRGDGTAFVMWDYDYLRQMSQGIETVVRYGTGDAEVNGKVVSVNPFLTVALDDNLVIKTQLVGAYNLPNVLATVAVGQTMGVSLEKIIHAIENYTPSNSRSQLMKEGTNTIVLDAYNANPTSMKVAIENFTAMPGQKKILVLGAMAEMGAETEVEHQTLINLIDKYNWDGVYLVGAAFSPFHDKYRTFGNAEEAATALAAQAFDHTLFLVKGSRSSQMEKVLPAIRHT